MENKVNALKTRLKFYTEIDADIEAEYERYDRICAKLYSIGSPEITDMPRNPSPDYDKMCVLVATKNEIEKEIEDQKALKTRERHWIEEMVTKIPQADEKAVIRMRYIDGMQWDEICKALYSKRGDYPQKELSYLRMTYKKHGDALSKISDLMDGGD